jgi:hypothetical protein
MSGFGGAVVPLSPVQHGPDLVGCNVPLSLSGFHASLGGRVLFVASPGVEDELFSVIWRRRPGSVVFVYTGARALELAFSSLPDVICQYSFAEGSSR